MNVIIDDETYEQIKDKKEQIKSSRLDRDSLIITGQKLPDGYQKNVVQEYRRAEK